MQWFCNKNAMVFNKLLIYNSIINMYMEVSMDIIRKYFVNRPIGFYISFSACVLSFIGAICYWLGYLLINNDSIGKFY